MLDKLPTVSRRKLVKFLARAENLYLAETVYHNKDHAADVTQALHVLLNFPCFLVPYLYWRDRGVNNCPHYSL